jgi:hypothetical protein
MPEDVHARETSPLLSPGQDPEGFVTALLDRPPSVSPSCATPTAARCPAGSTRWWPTSSSARAWHRCSGWTRTARQALRISWPHADQPEAERDPHWATQTHLLNPNGIRYAFIGRFEHFRAEFTRVCRHLGIEAKAGTAPNVACHGRRRQGPDPYRETEGAMIRTIYEADFRNFGYGWGTGAGLRHPNGAGPSGGIACGPAGA